MYDPKSFLSIEIDTKMQYMANIYQFISGDWFYVVNLSWPL